MDIKILDSWLRDYLKTEAKPEEIAKTLSLTSASIERIEPYKHNDFIYHVEITTNRPDMASIVGLAREAAAVLPRFEIQASFMPKKENTVIISENEKKTIIIENDDSLVRRICCVILEVTIGKSPPLITDRLDSTGNRSINNVIDITNYIMHEMGHPTHAFDYDRLQTKKLMIRPSKKGEAIVTLDGKTHILPGEDIVADDGNGKIVDLLGVMGTENSVVTNDTKRILFFIDNNDPQRIRKTSMSLAIRTEAAGLNEKDVDPELAMPTLLRGIELYQKYAQGKIVSDIIDIYPHPPKDKIISVTKEKIARIVGITIPIKESINILTSLGFLVTETNDTLEVTIPSWRNKDINIEEDIIEEIARIFGYHNIPSELPAFTVASPFHQESNLFFWEDRVKDAMKYWGFMETYTYSMVSEQLFEGPLSQAVTLTNPLDSDHIYMRKTLIPSLFQVVEENAGKEKIKIFELANVYLKQLGGLPKEVLTFSGIWKENGVSFYHMKGIIQQLANDCGIHNLFFTDTIKGGVGADIIIEKHHLGILEVLENNMVSFELNFLLFKQYATLKKSYIPIAKFPPVFEDITLIINNSIKTETIMQEIRKQSNLIKDVSLVDQFETARTFHIVYQDPNHNLSTTEIATIRKIMLHSLSSKYHARIK